MIQAFSASAVGAVLLLAASGLATGAVAGEADTVRVHYQVSLIGLPIGTAFVTSTVNGSSYRIEASGKLTGLASLVATSKGAATATGNIVGGHPAPASYAATAATSQKTWTARMAMAAGTVKGVDISPPIEEHPDRVPLKQENTRRIIDPLSAFVILVPGSGDTAGAAACNRTLPIFDGAARFDVTLSFVGTRNASAKGYSGPVAVCSARYTPIAGHRAERKVIQFMANNKDIEVWLAPVGKTRVVVPFRVSVLTMVGTTVIEATELTADAISKAAAVPH